MSSYYSLGFLASVLGLTLMTPPLTHFVRKFMAAKVGDVEPGYIEGETFTDSVWVGPMPEECEEFINLVMNLDVCEDLGCSLPKGILLYGLPGTGKTHFARHVASLLDAKFFSACASEFDNIYVGSGPSAIRCLFENAALAIKQGKTKRSIVFIDELDSLGSRKSYGFSDARHATIGQMLTCMDGLNSVEGITVIAATNCLEGVDTALIRSGRFDKIIKMGLPTEETRRKMIEKYIKSGVREKIGDNIINAVVEASSEFNCGDLKNFCHEITRFVVARAIKNNADMKSVTPEEEVSVEDVLAVFKRVYEKIENEPSRDGLMSIHEISNIFSKYGVLN